MHRERIVSLTNPHTITIWSPPWVKALDIKITAATSEALHDNTSVNLHFYIRKGKRNYIGFTQGHLWPTWDYLWAPQALGGTCDYMEVPAGYLGAPRNYLGAPGQHPGAPEDYL